MSNLVTQFKNMHVSAKSKSPLNFDALMKQLENNKVKAKILNNIDAMSTYQKTRLRRTNPFIMAKYDRFKKRQESLLESPTMQSARRLPASSATFSPGGTMTLPNGSKTTPMRGRVTSPGGTTRTTYGPGGRKLAVEKTINKRKTGKQLFPQKHSGGLIRSTRSYRLLKGEIVLSRGQRKGLTHGQIVKLIEKHVR